MTSPRTSTTPTRRRNWFALAVGIILVQFSYFPYAAAFVPPPGEPESAVDGRLIAIAVAIAPVVFVSVALLSRNSGVARRVLISMGLLLGLGLFVGLLSPVLGAAAGFGVGIALCLNLPDIADQMRRRMIGVALAMLYMLALLFLITPGGVLAGSVLPGLMVGFADEYGAWRSSVKARD